MSEQVESLSFYPFAYALLDDELCNYCWYCLKPPESAPLKKCGACKVAFFCDKACQQIGWSDHKIECKAFAKLTDVDTVPTVEVRMLGRLATRYKTIMTGRDHETADFYKNRESQRSIMELADHEEEIKMDPPAYKKFKELHSELLKFYGGRNIPDEETVFKLHCRNFINRHGISDKNYMKEIGKGLYLDLCAYDHSCRPNVIYLCDGLKATLRPLNKDVNIKDKSKTFYTYIDLLNHRDTRRNMLKGSWYFQCQCDRCMDESDHILTSIKCAQCDHRVCLFGNANKDKDTLKVTCPGCLDVVSKDRVTEGVRAMRFIDEILDRGEIEVMEPPQGKKFVLELLERFKKLLPTVNVYYVKLLQAAISFCQPSDKKELLDYHLQAEECMRICFPKNHPSLSYHLMNIGMWYYQFDKKDTGLPYLQEAREMIHFVLGKDHPFAEDIESCMAGKPPVDA